MALRVAPSARKALAACEKAMTASAGAWRLRCNSPIELKILPSPGDSVESFFHSLIAASNWPRDAKSCALCNTLLRSIAKSDLPIDQTLTVSLAIVNELGLWIQGGLSRNTKACPYEKRAGLPMAQSSRVNTSRFGYGHLQDVRSLRPLCALHDLELDVFSLF